MKNVCSVGSASNPSQCRRRTEAKERIATVAMNFALKDSMVERASGQTVEGGERSEVTELWTFMRARGGNWLLSAIQQT
ncbi:MAG: TIM44-like domain-containing protein [Xanthobacteraceae bacterium]